MLDLIGDVHGQSHYLKKLLTTLGYALRDGVYEHPTRKAFFIGDLVDRGPQQVETVAIVRAMVERGSAQIVMGNHELNAIAWATPDPESPGQYMRVHDERNRIQHRAFLDQFVEGSELYRDTIEWFKTLPVFVEEEGFRAIHACWHGPLVEESKAYLDANNAILPDAWIEVCRKGTRPFEIFESLLKGTEIELPAGISYFDPDGNERVKTRTRWWDETALTYRSAGMLKESLLHQLPEDPIPEANLLTYDQAKPLFIGHYWCSGIPAVLNPKMACLDYSIGKATPGTRLCAYRWDGEQTLTSDAFVWVEAKKPDLEFSPC